MPSLCERDDPASEFGNDEIGMREATQAEEGEAMKLRDWIERELRDDAPSRASYELALRRLRLAVDALEAAQMSPHTDECLSAEVRHFHSTGVNDPWFCVCHIAKARAALADVEE